MVSRHYLSQWTVGSVHPATMIKKSINRTYLQPILLTIKGIIYGLLYTSATGGFVTESSLTIIVQPLF